MGIADIDTSRRGFLKSSGALSAGLVIGMYLPGFSRRALAGEPVVQGTVASATYSPNAFIRIAPDNTVTVLIKHIEFGQGPFTGLTTLVAEELDADWGQMRAEAAPADVTRYVNLNTGMQLTGGSTAMANSYRQMRLSGAAARAMLLSAAASAWGVSAKDIRISGGTMSHPPSGRKTGFGEFADAAAKLPVPTDVELKKPEDFSLIGTDVPKLDSLPKSNGEAVFTMDIARPGMLTVLVAHPPRFGSKVASVDDGKARKMAGVEDVRVIPQGVAVYARDFWSAKKGRDALSVKWDDSGAETRSSEDFIGEYRKLARKPGTPAVEKGDVEAAIKQAATVVEEEYVFPFLAHAPMEPLDCVIEARDKEIETWFGSQGQTGDQQAIAGVFGLKPEDVIIHTQYAGGSFGRRAQQSGQFAAEAAEAAKAYGKSVPLKLVWTREDDIQGGFYRPIYVHRLRAGLDDNGKIVGWDHRIVGQSIFGKPPGTIDHSTVEGARNLPYDTGALRVTQNTTDIGVPPLWWRSVGSTHTAYSTETFLDQLFAKAGTDPVEGRLALLAPEARHRAVLEEAARMADWGGRVPSGRARGVAVHKSFGSYVAEVVELSRGRDGVPRVHKVWCAVDCGLAVNPNIVRAQMEGGIGFGLGAALFDEIELKAGRVQQSNFDRYRSLRIHEMPEIEVSVIRSAEAPTGVGEPGVPPIAPAVANAWHTLTGQRVYRLPFVRSIRS